MGSLHKVGDMQTEMKPFVLIASPQMKDPFFERTIVLVWHHDDDGAIGVVLNRPMEHFLADVLAVEDDVDLAPYTKTPVGWGGPVEHQSGTVVTRGQIREEEGWTLGGGLAVTRSQETLMELIRRRDPILLCLGYAGWGAGQLDTEISDGGWLYTDPDVALVFDVPADQRYERALASLGLDPKTLWMKGLEA
jgi:putative transcriptional regulator